MINRRRFLGTAAGAIAATQLASFETVTVDAGTPVTPQNNTAFESIKQIDAGVLNVGYAEAGPGNNRAVILLHGWPYDIYSFVDVAPLLSAKGYRVIVPYLRGYGTTKFLSDKTVRNGQQTAVA